MRKANLVVFDATVTTGGGVMTTDPVHNGVLGESNQLAAQLIVDLVSGTSPTLTFRVQHSADQINWVDRNVTAEVNAQPITAGTLTKFLVSDAGALPFLGYIRFQLTVLGTTGQAHVKVWVTTRDT